MNYDKFHVVSVVSNPVNYKSRYANYRVFEESILRKGAHFWTVEMCTGARQPQITDSGNRHHVQLWQTAIEGEMWHKEQLSNVGIHHVIREYPDCRYVMITDADLLYENDMLEKTIQALQHWPIVQAWSHIISLDGKGHVANVFKSFMFLRHNPKECKSTHPGYPPRVGSPGGAWAFRREILNQIGSALSGPIIDFGIAGSGDLYFARSVVGEVEKSCHKDFHPNYNKWLRQYQDTTDWIVQRNVGYVSNTARHLHHGSHEKRGYDWRNNILKKWQFDPETDLTKDASGLWRLVIRTPRQIGLRDNLRVYLRSRDEDELVT